MRLVSFRNGAASGVGIMLDDRRLAALAHADPTLPTTLRGLIAADALGAAERAAQGKAADYAIDEVTLDPVIPDPGSIWCVGLNYRSHQDETGHYGTEQPTLFLRIPASQVGHLQPIVKPKASDRLDYEGELAVIIGKPGRHVAPERAFDHVAGYACYNEGSVRDWQRHSAQYTPGKNFHATGGFGPWMVPRDAFGDPDGHTLVTRLNGQEMQRTLIGLMIYKIPKLISYISTVVPLAPGDVIVTGTPAGVGNRREPPVFMKPGDTVTVEITGIGTLVNPIAAEA